MRDLEQVPSDTLAQQPGEVLPAETSQAVTLVQEQHTATPGLPAHITPRYPAQDWAGVAHRAMDVAGSAWRGFWKFVKLGICVGLDIADFFIGRLLGFGIAFDIGCALIAMALWGHKGAWVLWEVLDITEQLDGFIPTCSIIALRAWNDN